MYILNNGDKVSADQIKTAFVQGKAVLTYSHRNNGTTTGLMLDGKHYDTRGQCHSVWDESWTKAPDTVQQALRAAHCRLN